MKEITDKITTIDWISIASCGIALLSAVFAYAQARVAHKSYKLQKAMYIDGYAKIDIMINENFFVDDRENKNVFFYFGIIISNLSDKQTSIKKYILKLNCEDIVYKPMFSMENLEHYNNLNRLSEPQNIEPHSAVAGWCVFILERNIYEKLNVNTYTLIVEDIHGVQAGADSVFLREELLNYEILKTN